MLSNISLSKPQVRLARDVKAFEKANTLMQQADFYLDQLKETDQKDWDRHKEPGVVVTELGGRYRDLVGSLEFDTSSGEPQSADLRYASYSGSHKSVSYQREGKLERFDITDHRRGGLAGRIGGVDYVVERNKETDTLVSFQEKSVLDKLLGTTFL